MTLTEPQVRALIAAAMAYDNRKPGEATVAAWAEAAKRAGWTYERALEAIHTHYARSTAFIMPGHITELVRAQASLPPRVELPPANPASEETRRKAMDAIRRFADRFKPPGDVA